MTRPELIKRLAELLPKVGVACSINHFGDLIIEPIGTCLFAPRAFRRSDSEFLVWALDWMEARGYRPEIRLTHDDEPESHKYTCVLGSFISCSIKCYYGPDRAYAVAEALLAVAEKEAGKK